RPGRGPGTNRAGTADGKRRARIAGRSFGFRSGVRGTSVAGSHWSVQPATPGGNLDRPESARIRRGRVARLRHLVWAGADSEVRGAKECADAAGGRGQSQSRERHRGRNVLVIVTQAALASILLVGSAFMIGTFDALRHVEPGFARPAEIQNLRINIPGLQVR